MTSHTTATSLNKLFLFFFSGSGRVCLLYHDPTRNQLKGVAYFFLSGCHSSHLWFSNKTNKPLKVQKDFV